MLDIIGGTYIENCIDPQYKDLFGSGLRGAAALCNKGFEINFHSCICSNYRELANYKSNSFGFKSNFIEILKTTEFHYYHPLSPPAIINLENKIYNIPDIESENFLYYGMIEANTKISGNYVTYDPQNHRSFKSTNSSAKHLALILNKNEAEMLSRLKGCDLRRIGQSLLQSENAEVVVIKNGSQGALIFENGKESEVPVFKTKKVWPIGTGDIFSAVFAWKWSIEKLTPHESASFASKFVAQYCETQNLPLNISNLNFEKLSKPKVNKHIYLAGPFFTFGERFLINELRNSLIDFGNIVFSPFHDVGVAYDNYSDQDAKEIADADLSVIKNCDAVLAVVSGCDPGTLYEIGYAKSLGKTVIVLAENMNKTDLTMLIGTDCTITYDLSTAVYKASW